MKLKRITFLTAALALAAMAGPNLSEARAGSITQTESIGQTATPINVNFDFAGYGGPAGTLISVELIVEETINGVVTVINQTQDSFLVSASITAPVTATSPAGDTTVDATAGFTDQSVPPGTTDFPGLSATLSNSSTYTGADMDPFYSPISIPVSVTSANGLVTGTPIAPGLFFGGSVTAAVKVTLIYNFADAVVPEPTSSAMFGIGIVLAAGYGWGRGRRRMNKLAA